MGKACAKIILCGEHAVVYNRPGIAFPLKGLYTLATVSFEPYSYTTDRELNEEEQSRIQKVFSIISEKLEVKKNMSFHIESNIPPNSGLGSSASLSVSIIKAISEKLSLCLEAEKINEIAFECEKLFHGKPSGIDNAVIAFEKPIFYAGGKAQFIQMKKPILLLVALSGSRQNTKDVVSEVRKNYKENRERYEMLFDEIGMIAEGCRKAIENSNLKLLGRLLTKNHLLLKEMGVSSPELDALTESALKAGAYGAKMTGAGKGGNIISIVDYNSREKVAASLKDKGAKKIIQAIIS